MQVKEGGLDVLGGWAQLKAFNEHLLINFAGAGATVLALQAEVGIMMMGGTTVAKSGIGIAARDQARAG